MFNNALEELQVMTGSVWGIDNHRFICGDLMDVSKSGLLDRYVPQVDMIYTDPPWNPGNFKMFYTHAKALQKREYGYFLDVLVGVLARKCPNGLVAMDMGIPKIAALDFRLKAHGYTKLAQNVTEYSGGECLTFIGSFRSGWALPHPAKIPGSLKGLQVIRHVMGILEQAGSTFFDPCCGKLVFAREAMKRGMTVYGCELNPAKLARGLLDTGMEVTRYE